MSTTLQTAPLRQGGSVQQIRPGHTYYWSVNRIWHLPASRTSAINVNVSSMISAVSKTNSPRAPRHDAVPPQRTCSNSQATTQDCQRPVMNEIPTHLLDWQRDLRIGVTAARGACAANATACSHGHCTRWTCSVTWLRRWRPPNAQHAVGSLRPRMHHQKTATSGRTCSA